VAVGAPADARSWTALTGSVTGAELTGLEDLLSLSVDSFGIELNTAGVGATALDWTQAVRFADSGAFGDPVIVVDAVGGEHVVDFTGATTRITVVGASIDLLDGLLTLEGSLSIELTPVDVDLNGDGVLDVDE